jgi:hypothetical protein
MSRIQDNSKNNTKNQIPNQNNLEHTEEVLDRQSRTKGMRRDDELIHDFPKAANLAQVLKGLQFPADKKTITQFIEVKRRQQNKGSNMNLDTDENIKEVFDLIIEKLPEEGRMYQNLFEVVEETKLVDSSNP